jgi:hypothetical protein
MQRRINTHTLPVRIKHVVSICRPWTSVCAGSKVPSCECTAKRTSSVCISNTHTVCVKKNHDGSACSVHSWHKSICSMSCNCCTHSMSEAKILSLLHTSYFTMLILLHWIWWRYWVWTSKQGTPSLELVVWQLNWLYRLEVQWKLTHFKINYVWNLSSTCLFMERQQGYTHKNLFSS